MSFDYMFLDTDASVGIARLGFRLFRVPVTSKTAGVGMTVDWKTFDNEWDPDDGWHLQLGAGTYHQRVGMVRWPTRSTHTRPPEWLQL